VLAAAVLAPAARAQVPGRPPVVVQVPRITTINVRTTVTVPDRGEATLAAYNRLAEGRSQYGAPGLGKMPYLGRGFGNVGYGRSAVSGRVSVRVRIIDLREEEYRQTGYRSR
jgi:hypothetical protein